MSRFSDRFRQSGGLASSNEGMKRRSPAKGRLGLLAAPLILAAMTLALSACGSSAPSSSAAPDTTSAPATSPAPASTSPGSTSAPGGSPDSSPNTAQFCWTWQETAPYFSKDFAVLGNDPNYDMSTPAVLFTTASVGIGAGLQNASDSAPAAVSPDMDTVMNYWNASYADFRYESSINQNVTVAQVKAYIQAHPPAQAAEVGPAVQAVSGFLAANCHVNLGS
jgi:hypothetical protein